MHSILSRNFKISSRLHINTIRSMSGVIEDKIASMGLQLPGTPLAPKGNYMSYNISGKYVYLAGHLPQPAEGELMKGRLGEDVSLEEGAKAAQLCGLQMIASLKAATDGDLSKIKSRRSLLLILSQ